MDKTEALKIEADNTDRFFEQMDQAAKRNAADHAFFTAAKKTRIGAHDDGLMPHWEDYEWHYSAEQGAKAACLTREDVIALSYIQRSVLKRLDRNRNYLWLIIALLLYIANKFN